MTISAFKGKYAFLSNFWSCPVVFDARVYKSVEAAYQAAKTSDMPLRRWFEGMGPVQAKKAGKTLRIRNDWNDVKLGIMHDLVLQKFSSNPDLKQLLLATGDEELVEGNRRGDTFWGVCDGQGENHLGQILMRVRKSLSTQMKD